MAQACTIPSMPGPWLVVVVTADGEEREERWPTLEAFRTWAAAERMRGTWSAFREDDDGEWVLEDRGRLLG